MHGRPTKRPSFRGLLAAVVTGAGLFLSAGSAAAQEAGPFRVTQDRYVLLPGGQSVGVERTVTPREEIMRTSIGYSAAAQIAEPVSVMLAGVPIDLTGALPLPEVRPSGGTRDRVGRDARIFCGTERRVDHIAAPPPKPHPTGRRFEKHVTPCLVDADRDGRLESAFLVGTKWASDRLLVQVPPVAYEEVKDIPLPGSSAWVTFEKGALLQGPILRLNVSMFGRPLPLAAVKLGTGKERKGVAVERTIRREVYPDDLAFGAARITLLGYEPEGRQLRVRVDQPFERADLGFEFVSNTIYIYY